MDKRVIAIIIILIIGCSCMFYAATSSNTVGSAITTFSKTTLTLPYGFSVGETNDKLAELYNKNTDEKINISDLGKGDSSSEEFKDALEKLSKDPSVMNVKDSTKTINNLQVYTITYETSSGVKYSSFVYTYNHTYCINMTGFDDVNKVNDDLDLIVKTIQPDYKQGKD